MRSTLVLSALILALILVGCGDDAAPKPEKSPEGKSETAAPGNEPEPAKTPTKADLVKKALLDLVKAAKAGDGEAASKFIVYRGPDKARKWKSLCDYGNENEKAYVDRLMKRIAGIAAEGEFTFDRFRSETEGEGEWLAWEVTAGKEKAVFAFLAIGEGFGLGDID